MYHKVAGTATCAGNPTGFKGSCYTVTRRWDICKKIKQNGSMAHPLSLPNDVGICCISMPKMRNLCDQILTAHSHFFRNFLNTASDTSGLISSFNIEFQITAPLELIHVFPRSDLTNGI